MIDFFSSDLPSVILIKLPIHAVPTAAVISVRQVGIRVEFAVYFEQVHYSEQYKYNKY